MNTQNDTQMQNTKNINVPIKKVSKTQFIISVIVFIIMVIIIIDLLIKSGA
jgi:hypothetical protein